jgi:hypothetical protein
MSMSVEHEVVDRPGSRGGVLLGARARRRPHHQLVAGAQPAGDRAVLLGEQLDALTVVAALGVLVCVVLTQRTREGGQVPVGRPG